jgi:RNA binding exosome subunit
MVSAELTRRGPATKSLARLGQETLEQLGSELSMRMDEENVIHIRLDLLDLIAGKVTLTLPGDRATIKGKTKLQVYPGDDVIDIANQTLNQAIELAQRLNLEPN